jgi:O-antigen/teichoic acid export membrane protein
MFSGTARRYTIVAVSWGGRFASLGTQLLLTPFLLHLLGDRRFSVFQIMLSLSGWFLLCSLGMGAALKNFISSARARGEPDVDARRLASLYVLVALVVFVSAFVLVAPALSGLLFDRLTQGAGWARLSFWLGGALMIVIGIGQVGYEALFADVRGHWAYVLPAVAQSVGLLLIYGLSRSGLPMVEPLLWAVGLWLGPQAAAAVIALGMAGLIRAPSWKIPESIAQRVVGSAGKFFLLMLLSNAVLLVDYIVMSQILMPDAIVLYSIMMRMVTTLLLFYTATLMLFWPEWSRELHAGRVGVVKRQVLWLAGGGALLCGVGAGAGILTVPALARLWLGRPEFDVSPVTTLFFFGYLAIRVWTDTYSVGLMSYDQTRWLLGAVIAQAIITLPAEVFFGRMFGSNGVILGLIAGYLVTATWMLPYYFDQAIRLMTAAGKALPS